MFGNDVQLQCHVGLETTGRARQWSRGKDQRLLIFNGNSTNEDKYTEAYHKTLSVLTIKNFEIDDVNIKYVCQQGFSIYSNTLKLMPDIFECKHTLIVCHPLKQFQNMSKYSIDNTISPIIYTS